MARYGIQWKQGDYIKLGQAISQFNKKIKELEKEENNLNLPELQDYKIKKETITTRNELDRYIKSLKRFQLKSQQESIKLEGGEIITKWEKAEISKAKNRIISNLNTELKELQTPRKGQKYSRAEMGSERVREIERELQRIEKWDKKTKSDFKDLRESIFRRGTSDYIFRKQVIYKQNFMKMLNEFENYRGYKEFKKAIENLNPQKFYDTINVQEGLTDIQYYYDVKDGKVVPSGFTSEEVFLNILDKMNISYE